MSEINDKIHVVKRVHADSQLPVYSTAGAAAADVCAYLTEGSHIKTYGSDKDESDCRVEICTFSNKQVPVPFVSIAPGERVLIPTGLIIIPGEGYELQVRPRSGFPLKMGLLITNSPGTVDEDYRGELGIGLVNVSKYTVMVNHGERIAQVVLAPVVRLFAPGQDTLVLEPDGDIYSVRTNTDRGAGSFGSTGK